jgi:acyl-CoA dehydrogenase
MNEPSSIVEDSAARLFADHVDAALRERVEGGEFASVLWRHVVDAGFDKALVREADGGSAMSFAAAAPLFTALGHWQVPLPLAETMLGALLLSCAGIDIPDGPLTIVEQGCGNDLTLHGSGGATRLQGHAHGVPWARHAGHVVMALDDGDVVLVDLGTPRVERRAHADQAGIGDDTLVLHGAPIAARGRGSLPLARPAWALGALARSLMICGALEAALELSLRYAGERVQFGRPIGANQALQQQLALFAGDAAAARVAALVAAADAPDASGRAAPGAPFSIAVAKVRCGEAATRCAAIAHQVHGAIGYAREHALHHATRRLRAWRAEFGSDAWWAGHLGRATIAGGSSAFWPAITARRFDDATFG